MPNKIINYDVFLKATNTFRQVDLPKAYTNDLNSIEFNFTITDMTASDLTGATASTLIYMADGSFFQNTDVILSGNIFKYTLKENEGNHSGVAQIQLVVKIGTQEFATQKYEFEIISGLDTEVAVEVMIQDWTTLTAEARTFLDDIKTAEATRVSQFNEWTNEATGLEARFNQAISGVTIDSEVIDARVDATGVSRTTLKDRLDKEQQEVTAQLAQKANQTALEVEKARINNLIANAGDVTNNAELLDIRVGYDGITYTTAGEAVRQTIGAYKTIENESWVV